MNTPHERLTRTTFSLPFGEVHACLERSLPAPLEYYRAIVRPLTTFVDRVRKTEAHIATRRLQLHGSDDGCFVPPTDEDRRWFDAGVLEVMPNLGHFLHVESPTTIAARASPAGWRSATRAWGARRRDYRRITTGVTGSREQASFVWGNVRANEYELHLPGCRR